MNYAYFLDLKDITRYDIRRFNLEKTAVSENDGLQSESLFQFIDDRPGLEFLDKTDSCVKQQQRANDTKIDPIFETSSQNGGSLSKTKLSARMFREKEDFSRLAALHSRQPK